MVIPIQQTKSAISYPQLSGELLGGSPNWGLPWEWSLNQNSPRGLPLNPHVGFYGW
jgi:hypothetical protein